MRPKQLRAIIFVLLLVLGVSGCSKQTLKKTNEKTLTPEEQITEKEKLAGSLKQLDAVPEPTGTRIPEFDKVNEVDLDNVMLDSLATAMLKINSPNENVLIEKFDKNNISGCSARFEYGWNAVMIFDFPDNTSAKQYMLAYASRLPEQGYGFVERLNYNDTSVHFQNENNMHIYLLQKGSHLILMRKYVS